MEKDVLKYFLPAGLLDYFTITGVAEKPDKKGKDKDIYIYLEENSELRSVANPHEYESKGFYAPKTIQDFPIRGKAVYYLVIKRRRWRHKENANEIVSNDYNLFAEGVKLTQEVSDFLKSTGRDPRRYD